MRVKYFLFRESKSYKLGKVNKDSLKTHRRNPLSKTIYMVLHETDRHTFQCLQWLGAAKKMVQSFTTYLSTVESIAGSLSCYIIARYCKHLTIFMTEKAPSSHAKPNGEVIRFILLQALMDPQWYIPVIRQTPIICLNHGVFPS